jgi:hypothetical protein
MKCANQFCPKTLPPHAGRGRPRQFCDDCRLRAQEERQAAAKAKRRAQIHVRRTKNW